MILVICDQLSGIGWYSFRTLNYWFGSRMMTEDGIIANNEMLDFSFGQSADPSQNEVKMCWCVISCH